MVTACAAVLHGARSAEASPRVVLVENRDGPSLPALAAQVRLQGGDVEIVAVVGEGATGPVYVETAAQLAAEHDAILVVWVTQEDSDDAAAATYVVYAVGRSSSRAVIELVRVDASTPASEIERVIALKVGSLLDSLLAPAPVVTVLGVPPPPRAPPLVSNSAPPVATTPPRWWIDIGTAVAAGGGDRGVTPGLAVAVTRRWGSAASSIGAQMISRWLPSHGIDDPVARVSIIECDALAGIDATTAAGPLDVFAATNAGVAVLWANGATPDGRTGSLIEVVPLAGAAAGARLSLSGPVSVSVSLGYERALIHQRFLVDGQAVVDLGQGRFLAMASMSVALR